MIVRFDGADRSLAEAIYDLHTTLGSPVTKLGRDFAIDFYYGAMVRNNIIGCNLYIHDGEVAGFSAYSESSNDMFRRGVLGAPVCLVWSLVKGILKKPSTFRTVLSILRQFTSMDKEPAYDIPAEMLSMVVKEKYRSPAFVKETGVRVTNALFETTMNYLESKGGEGIKMFVDRGNILAHVLYLRYGFVVESECRRRGRDSLVYVKRFNSTQSCKKAD